MVFWDLVPTIDVGPVQGPSLHLPVMTQPDLPQPVSDSSEEASSSQSGSPTIVRTGRVEMCPMDGNCLFHAAFRELKRLNKVGNVSSPRSLRRTVVDWVATSGSETECADLTLSQWIELETEEDLNQYVARMRRDGEWGGIIELYAMTEMFQVTTCVWEPAASSGGGQRRYTQRHSLESHRSNKGQEPGPETARGAAHLHYNGTSHYSVFVPDCPPAAHPTGAPATTSADRLTSAPQQAASMAAEAAEAPAAVPPQRSSSSAPASRRKATSGNGAVEGGRSGRGLHGGSESGRAGSARSTSSISSSTSEVGGRRPTKSARTTEHDVQRPLSASQRAALGVSGAASSSSSSSGRLSPAHSDRGVRRAPSAGTKRRAAAVAVGTHPMPLRDSLPLRGGRQMSSARRHSAAATPAVALRPLTGTTLSSMSVKLGLRLDRGGALPARPSHLPREVRV